MNLLKSLAVVCCLSLGLLMVNFGSADDGQSKANKAGAAKVAAAQQTKAQKKPNSPLKFPNFPGLRPQ